MQPRMSIYCVQKEIQPVKPFFHAPARCWTSCAGDSTTKAACAGDFTTKLPSIHEGSSFRFAFKSSTGVKVVADPHHERNNGIVPHRVDIESYALSYKNHPAPGAPPRRQPGLGIVNILKIEDNPNTVSSWVSGHSSSMLYLLGMQLGRLLRIHLQGKGS